MTELTATFAAEPELEPTAASPGRKSLGLCIVNIIVLIVPFLGLAWGIYYSWGVFSGVELGLFLSMYLLTLLGITVGYHRLFTHRSFETTLPIQCIFAILGSMALQGSLLKWVALHRIHHQHSDLENDPHSPLKEGHGIRNWLRGAWHAHIGWFFNPDPPGLYRYVKDLKRSRALRIISDLFPLWVFLGLVIPAAIGGWLTGSWRGAFLGFLWGGLIRLFMAHHVTWSINSICHLFGARTYKTTDQSRNNVLFGILALGEGWHNNHHAFPSSARHGLEWWQFDLSYIVIRFLQMFGLAWKVKVPADDQIPVT